MASLANRLPHARTVLIALVVLAGLLTGTSIAAASNPPEPTYGSATVDGNYGEWNLANDFFASMYTGGDPSKPKLSNGYLRYDCSRQTMYVLVLQQGLGTGSAVPLLASPADAWATIDGGPKKQYTGASGNDGTPPDFAWIGQGYDGNGDHVQGYEASFSIAPGTYTIVFHAEAHNAGADQTSANVGFRDTFGTTPLVIDCSHAGRTPTIATHASPGGTLGTQVHDTATLDGGGADPYSGTITYKLYANDSCSGTPTTTLTRPITVGDGSYDSPSYSPTAVGSYWWVASFASSSPNVDGAGPTACNDPAEKVTITSSHNPRADLEIRKSATPASIEPGQSVTYSFAVTNHGPDDAHHVTVKDPVPHGMSFVSGDPGCSYAGGTVTCAVGTVPAGATVAEHVTLKLARTYNPAAAPTDGQLDVQKVEQFQGIAAHQTSTFALSCPTGYTMTEGVPRVDSVDQGTGHVDDVHFLASHSDPGHDGRWIFQIENATGGQAQVHLFGVCVAKATSGPLPHMLKVSGLKTAKMAVTPGQQTKTLSCPAGKAAIAPGFELTGGARGSQYRSEASPDGSSWTFGFAITAPGKVRLSIRCLDQRTTTDGRQYDVLRLTHTDAFASVPPSDPNSSQPYGDYRVTCPDDAKGIVGTYDLPDGVTHLGSTPEPKNRDFRLYNTSGTTQTVHLDLICLGIRVGYFGGGGSIYNQAWVYADEPDTNPANDVASFVLTVAPAH